jgi:hypothetical protein
VGTGKATTSTSKVGRKVEQREPRQRG